MAATSLAAALPRSMVLRRRVQSGQFDLPQLGCSGSSRQLQRSERSKFARSRAHPVQLVKRTFVFRVRCCLLVVGCWLLVVGCWLLVVGCWLLFVGCCGCVCLFGCLFVWLLFVVVVVVVVVAVVVAVVV